MTPRIAPSFSPQRPSNYHHSNSKLRLSKGYKMKNLPHLTEDMVKNNPNRISSGWVLKHKKHSKN